MWGWGWLGSCAWWGQGRTLPSWGSGSCPLMPGNTHGISVALGSLHSHAGWSPNVPVLTNGSAIHSVAQLRAQEPHLILLQVPPPGPQVPALPSPAQAGVRASPNTRPQPPALRTPATHPCHTSSLPWALASAHGWFLDPEPEGEHQPPCLHPGFTPCLTRLSLHLYLPLPLSLSLPLPLSPSPSVSPSVSLSLSLCVPLSPRSSSSPSVSLCPPPLLGLRPSPHLYRFLPGLPPTLPGPCRQRSPFLPWALHPGPSAQHALSPDFMGGEGSGTPLSTRSECGPGLHSCSVKHECPWAGLLVD